MNVNMMGELVATYKLGKGSHKVKVYGYTGDGQGYAFYRISIDDKMEAGVFWKMVSKSQAEGIAFARGIVKREELVLA